MNFFTSDITITSSTRLCVYCDLAGNLFTTIRNLADCFEMQPPSVRALLSTNELGQTRTFPLLKQWLVITGAVADGIRKLNFLETEGIRRVLEHRFIKHADVIRAEISRIQEHARRLVPAEEAGDKVSHLTSVLFVI